MALPLLALMKFAPLVLQGIKTLSGLKGGNNNQVATPNYSGPPSSNQSPFFGGINYDSETNQPTDKGMFDKLNAPQAILGGAQTIGGLIGLSKLQKQKWPEYEATPELLAASQRSAQRAKMGFTPQQESAFKSNLSSMLNADYRNAVNMSGGNLAQAITARNQASRIRGMNQFAVDDANLMASNIREDNMMIGRLQGIADMRTQSAERRRIMLEQAYGGAVQSGLKNTFNAFNLQSALNQSNSTS